jgi:ribonucleoside-diphosphate reductase alpha chain
MQFSSDFSVIKRDGSKEEVSFDKVTRRLKNLSDGLDVNPILVAQKVCSQIYNHVPTQELDELSAQICISMETTHLDYGVLASRIIISNHHKSTSNSFSETVQILYDQNMVHSDLYRVTMEHKERIDAHIDYNRDYLFDYFAFKTLERSYLMKINHKVVERIQHLFMRVSIGIHQENIEGALQSYNMLSQKYFTHATPTLYHCGTLKPQLASCFLMGMEDSVDGIYKAIADCAKISACAGGIGMNISKIRSKNAYIHGVNGFSNGIVPLCRVMNETARHINQAGKRPGSFAIYIEPHHNDILDFLELKKNTGAESERTRDLFLALWISDLFMKRVKNDEQWSLFDPNECPFLSDTFGEEYEKLYTTYEEEKRYKRQVPARRVWNYILTSQIETGVPYILFKDHINRKNNQENVGIIRNSNLCAEILEYSDENEYAVCTLASIALPRFVDKELTFDFDKLIEVIQIVVQNLNKIIDINYYPLPETKLSNERHRPIGIGVQGLADVFAKMGLAFESAEARELNRFIFETLYYGALKASNELSIEKGETYSTFQGSPLSRGLFQFDLWNVQPSDRYAWDELRKSIQTHGVMNSLLVAIMPTASTSQILGNNECIEPYTSNIYTRRTIAGDFVVINKYLVNDLMKLGLWNKELKDAIVANNGSIQPLGNIPENIKQIYKTVWEIKQKSIIDMAIERGPFICQTQSMNLFFEEPNHKNLSSSLFYGWEKGLKTGSYYIRSKPKAQAQQFTIAPKETFTIADGVCESCSA